jgi:transposase
VSTLDLTLEPEPVVVRRFEVITDAAGRRRWPEEAKARIVAEAFAPGAVVSEIARRHGLTPQQVFTWCRVARRAAEEASDALPAFVPAVVASGEASGPAAAPAGWIEIVLGAAVVRVPPGVDEATLTRVLRAMKAVP